MTHKIKISCSGGYHNSDEIRFIVPKTLWQDFENGFIGIREVLTKDQLKRADRHFCGIKGCTCGGINRAYIEKVED